MASQTIKQAPARRARNSLSREIILDAAQNLARSGSEISLRSVAAILKCSAMALYRHFPDKQDLLLGLLDRVIGSIDLADETAQWDERLVRLTALHLKVLQANPWAIPLLFEFPDPGPAVRKIGEAMLAALKAGGASDEVAVSTFSSILALNYGWAGFTAIGSQALPSKLATSPSATEGLRTTSQLWAQFESLGADSHHQMAVRKLISNLA